MKKRFEQALNCETTDQVPFLPAIYEHKAWFVGSTPSKVCKDAELLTTALLAEYESVQPDALTIGIDVYNVEPEAVGCTVTYYDDNNTSVPAITTQGAAIQRFEEIHSLKSPDPHKEGRMPLNLEVAANVMKALGNEVPIRGALSGPFSMAAHLVGPEHLFLLPFTQPDLLHKLLQFCCDVTKRYGAEFIRLGCGVVLFDSQASCDLLDPQIYREFVLPKTRTLIEDFRGLGVRNVPLIIGGNTTKMLTEYLETGANNILCDFRSDAKEFLAGCSSVGRAFRRNVDSTDFLAISSDEVHRRTLKYLEESNAYPGFILGTAVLPYGVPLSHMAAMREAIQEFKVHKR